jgi:serine protease
MPNITYIVAYSIEFFNSFCMKRFSFTLLALCVMGSFLHLAAQQVHPHYVDGELFWRVKAGTQAMLPDSIMQVYQVREVRSPFTPLNPNQLAGRGIIEQLHRTYRIRFDSHARLTELASYLAAQRITELVEKVPLMQTDFTPNDPQFATQWHLATIDAANAWNVTVGNPLVRVAIVDDAVLRTHQDLAGSIWVNPLENPNNAIDDDGNGYVNDVSGYDVADNDNNPNPPLAFATSSVYTHGTHCAGIAAAHTNNATGVAAIGFGIKIIPVKCNNDATPGPTLPAAYDGVTYAITLQPEVMSLSWGGPGSSATAQLLFDLAYANDIVVVAAAGNSNVNTPMYPASYNHVISVAATATGDFKASFSNYGPTIDVSAPGVNILSTLAGNTSDYGLLSGTSMACPLTAGLCGLMRSFNPAKTVDQIETCLKSTADPIDALNPGSLGSSAQVASMLSKPCNV